MARKELICGLAVVAACEIERGADQPFVTSGSEVTLPGDGDEDGEDVGESSGGFEPVPDQRELFIADPSPPPITGGAITVLGDAATVVVSDPDRGLLHVVDLAGAKERAVVVLGADAQPWRAVEDPAGAVHVVLRGTGEVATLDPIEGVVTARRSVCSHPRGIALVPSEDAVLVACAAGELVRLPLAIDGAAETLAIVEPDLRDVFVVDGTVHVTRFRSAEVLALDEAGAIVDRMRAPGWVEGLQDATMRASTAWRTVPVPGGGWLMAHQGGSDADVDLDEDHPIPYGGIGPCSAIVQSTATLAAPDGVTTPMGSLDRIPLPVDVTLDPTGRWAVLVAAGTCPDGCGQAKVVKVDLQASLAGLNPPCQSPEPLYYGADDPLRQLIAVAYSHDRHLLVQQRDPAALLVVTDVESAVVIALDGEAIEDTGHRLFHEVGAAGLACASCHAEGGDDGLVWDLGGPRHTPALDVGLAGTAPFHWTGELYDFGSLVSEVHEGRMGEMIQSPERVAAFEAWVTALGEAPIRAMDEPASAGRELFAQYRCDTCHAGAATTNNQTVVAGWGLAVQVPSLHAIGLHPPYMHDGRAATLADAVRDMIARTMPAEPVGDDDVEQLVAYLQTL